MINFKILKSFQNHFERLGKCCGEMKEIVRETKNTQMLILVTSAPEVINFDFIKTC